MGIGMWEVIRLCPVRPDEVVVMRGVSACGDDGEVYTRYIDHFHVDDPSTIWIEVSTYGVIVSFDEMSLFADEVEDGREDRFHPVWHRPTEEVE